MKILHVAYSLGESSAATRLAESQAKSHDIYFMLGKQSKYKFVRQCTIYGFPIRIISLFFRMLEKIQCAIAKIPEDEMFSFGRYSLLQTFFIKKAIRKYDIDCIHLHWGGAGFMPVGVFRDLPVPLVITAHDYHCFSGGCHIPMSCSQFQSGCVDCPLTEQIWARRYITRNMARNSYLLKSIKPIVIAPSHYVKERIAPIHPDIKVEVVPNSLGSFQALNGQNIDTLINVYQAHLEANKNMVTIIVVGVSESYRKNKGKDVLVETLTSLHHEGVKVKLISIGDYYPLELVCERLHISSASSAELVQLYAVSDLCLVPSRYETFSQVTLEAIVCGTPVVAFDLTGPRDIIVNNKTGYLVPSFDIAKYAKTAVNWLQYKRNNINSCRKYSIDTLHNFSQLSIAEQHDAVYKQAKRLNQ